MTLSLVEPEHGPPPYQQYDVMPQCKSRSKSHTNTTSNDVTAVSRDSLSAEDMDAILWDINSHVKDLVVNKYLSSSV